MRLSLLSVRNLRSITDSQEFGVPPLLAFVGENNAGKSNLLRAVEVLVSAGAGGLTAEDFKDRSVRIVIKGTFDNLSQEERKRWKSYLVDGKLILEKQAELSVDEKTGKDKVAGEYHGYRAEPTEWYLSIPKITAKYGDRPKWLEIVNEIHLPAYFIRDGKCTKADYTKALEQYLTENDVDYDTPDLSSTQALGLQSNVVASLPSVYLLSAITDYSNEIDKRSSTTTFRRLMGDLADRILKLDPRYSELQSALDTVRKLLNSVDQSGSIPRMESLSIVESRIAELLKKLMPSVQQIGLSVEVQDTAALFTAGVTLDVDDGVRTDVLAKGNGLQRCVVFTLLQALILNQRSQLMSHETVLAPESRSIILLIEEPELYIHPQLGKLFYDVMREFSTTDQIIYSTHSPLFVDAYEYQQVAIVSKPTVLIGTKVKVCNTRAFDQLSERKIFKGLAQLNPSINEMFFARRVLLVEGQQDMIAVTSVLKYEGRIRQRIEELDWTGIVCGGKQSIPFFQMVLNAFDIPYAVLHDSDMEEGMPEDKKNAAVQQNSTIKKLAGSRHVHTYPVKLEKSLELKTHFGDQYDAHCFFQNPDSITDEVKNIINGIFI